MRKVRDSWDRSIGVHGGGSHQCGGVRGSWERAGCSSVARGVAGHEARVVRHHSGEAILVARSAGGFEIAEGLPVGRDRERSKHKPLATAASYRRAEQRALLVGRARGP